MKHFKFLLCLSLVLFVSGCGLVCLPWTAKSTPPLTHKTNNAKHRSPVVQNPARFPPREQPSVMAAPHPPRQPLPDEVRF